MRWWTILVCCALAKAAGAQQILHYSETSGYDHNTRSASLAMFQDLGALHGFTVVDDQDGSQFNSLTNLQQYDVIVFSNTSGNAILDPSQRLNYEDYIISGGDFMGIHAASDTYRHTNANGNNTGTWDFYAIVLGASVQENPNHVAGTPSYAMQHIGTHPSTTSLPDPWVKNEEYYYWENGYLRPDNFVVLEVEQTVGPNGMVNSYDAPRPMSWYRFLPNDSRIFYTALGHDVSNFTSDSLFITHIRDALLWMLDPSTSIAPLEANDDLLIQGADGLAQLTVQGSFTMPATVQVFSMDGQLIFSSIMQSRQQSFKVPDQGMFLVNLTDRNGKVFSKRLVTQ